MDYFAVCVVALFAAALTFFSGFGLGTLLMPAFAVFFPVEVAVAATAVVHLANNVFKLGLMGRRADGRVLVRFAVPAMVAALGGAAVLAGLSEMPAVARYGVGAREAAVTPIKLALAVLIAGFAVMELMPRFDRLAFSARWLPVGGLVSGFFGGLSGHQGALRSAFLIRAGLSKEGFIATGIVSSVMVDIARLAVYGAAFFTRDWEALREGGGVGLVVAASGAALAGSVVGLVLVRRVTIGGIRRLIGVLLLGVAGAMGAGVV